MADETEGQIGPVLDRIYFQWTANNEYAISHHVYQEQRIETVFYLHSSCTGKLCLYLLCNINIIQNYRP